MPHSYCVDVNEAGRDLHRFVDAQDRGGTYTEALSELRAGRKRSHWIWFVFPQIAGLGSSEMSRRYAIGSRAEARAYLEHPVLGPRLIECAGALLALPGSDPAAVMGELDAVKLRSSMTLFALTEGADPIFARVLDRYFGGVGDRATEQRLRDWPGSVHSGAGPDGKKSNAARPKT